MEDRYPLLCISVLLLSIAVQGGAFSTSGAATRPPRNAITAAASASAAPTASAATSPGATHALQRIWDELSEGAELDDVADQLMDVDTELFAQASAWSKTFTPLRTVVAEVAADDGRHVCISVVALPQGVHILQGNPAVYLVYEVTNMLYTGGTKLEWWRHDGAQSISVQLFGSLNICDLELQESETARKLEQQELEATYTDAWAVGGSEESDCVCRGGRCPRMWDCPFWVDRRRAEAKGSSAHVALRVSEDAAHPAFWRAGSQTVRRVEALEPSALLEIHMGPRNLRYYQEIASQVEGAVELIEILSPRGVKPGVCRYLGPSVDIRHQ